MKYLNKYKKFESVGFKDEVEDIIDIMVELLEDYDPWLKSLHGTIKYHHYLNKNHKYKLFKPVYKAGNKIRGNLEIVFNSLNYEKMSNIIEEMKSPIGRLSDIGWYLSDLEIGTNDTASMDKLKVTFLSYQFKKKDIISKTSNEITKKEIIKIFDKHTQLSVEEYDIDIDDDYIILHYDSKSYDGRIPEDVENSLNVVCELLGCNYFENDVFNPHSGGVKFWFE